jgi:hypothetical protein
VEEHVTRGLAALRESLKEIGWAKEQVGELASRQVSDDEREWE